MELTIESIQQLMKLMSEHKVDRLKLGDLELTKTKHEAGKNEATSLNKSASVMDDEELLFWSSSAPPLTAQQLEELAANGAGLSKPVRKSKKTKEI